MMKIIAGIEKPDSGTVNKKIKIAYKPQYLQNDLDVEVVALWHYLTKQMVGQ